MWGPPGLDVLQKVDGMRERVRAIDAYTETGAAECREVFGRYHGLLHQIEQILHGVALKNEGVYFKWSDSFSGEEGA